MAAGRLRIGASEAAVIALAASGGFVFSLLGVPAAWLSGAMLCVSVVGLFRRLPPLRRPWFDSTMIVSGVLIGSSATPDALAATTRYPGSLAVLMLGLCGITFATGAYLRYVARWSWIDSLLAAAPGALSTVIAVAQDKGANIGRIAVIQLFRILVLIAVLPGAMMLTSGAPAGTPASVPILSVGATALLLACALASSLLFERLGVTAPFILGATLSSAVLHATGTVAGTLPPEIATAVMVMLGAAMGGRVSNLKRGEVAALFPLAIGSFAVSLLVACAFAWPAAWLAGVPYTSAMAAFAPGGLEAMAMLAIAMGLDPLYVGSHHLARFMVVSFVMPFLIVRLKPEEPPR